MLCVILSDHIKNCLYLFSTSVQYVLEKQTISSELVQNYLLGAEGVVINMKPVTWNTETVKGNNIIGNGLNIWILNLRIK